MPAGRLHVVVDEDAEKIPDVGVNVLVVCDVGERAELLAATVVQGAPLHCVTVALRQSGEAFVASDDGAARKGEQVGSQVLPLLGALAASLRVASSRRVGREAAGETDGRFEQSGVREARPGLGQKRTGCLLFCRIRIDQARDEAEGLLVRDGRDLLRMVAEIDIALVAQGGYVGAEPAELAAAGWTRRQEPLLRLGVEGERTNFPDGAVILRDVESPRRHPSNSALAVVVADLGAEEIERLGAGVGECTDSVDARSDVFSGAADQRRDALDLARVGERGRNGCRVGL